MLHLKFVIRNFFGLISIPNYLSFTKYRFRAFRLRISECGFRNYKEFITTNFGKLSFEPSAGAMRQGSGLKAQGSMLNVNPLLKIHASTQKAQSSALSPHGLYFILIPLLFALCAMPLPVANAAQVTLGWDSNSEPDLEGYVIYRNAGSPGPPYDYSGTLPEDDLTDPLHPKITLTGLNEGQEYYIALTAYNTEGVESSFSNDVCVEVVNNIAEPCAASTIPVASKSSSGGGGGGGNSCFITTTSHKSSMFAKFVAKPAIFSPVLMRVILCLILIGAAIVVSHKNVTKSVWHILG